MPPDLIEQLPDRIETALAQVLGPEETVHIKLKGAFKEGLICTDKRVIILKGGYLSGQALGTNTYQLTYAMVGGVQVTFHLSTGYFELNAGGMQNVRKSYWSSKGSTDAARAPNCIRLNSQRHREKFQMACSFILQKLDGDGSGGPPAPAAAAPQSPILIADELAKLSALRNDGVLSDDEFTAMKQRLLGNLEPVTGGDTATLEVDRDVDDEFDEVSDTDAEEDSDFDEADSGPEWTARLADASRWMVTSPVGPTARRKRREHREAGDGEARVKKGWHPDPWGHAALRWHDGKEWTPHTR